MVHVTPLPRRLGRYDRAERDQTREDRRARPTGRTAGGRVVDRPPARPDALGFDFASLVGGVSYSNFLEAFDVALDLATTAQPLSEAIIRRLHERVTDPQDT